MTEQTIYEQNGFKDRKEYVKDLATEYDVPLRSVVAIAQLLGPSEDFDGLVALVSEMEYLS